MDNTTENQDCHDANFVVTGGAGGCCYDIMATLKIQSFELC